MLRSESSAFVLIDCKISKAKNIERPRLASGRIFGCTSGDNKSEAKGHVPRVRVGVGDGGGRDQNRVVLLWFYFRPSYGGSSMRATILAEGLILPVKIVNAFDGFILGSNPSGGEPPKAKHFGARGELARRLNGRSNSLPKSRLNDGAAG